MKARRWLWQALVPVAIAAGGCSGGLDCDAFCQKGVECGGETTLEQCLQQCADYSRLISSQFANSVEACYTKSCTEIQTCVENALKTCSGNINSFLDKFCAKVVSCNSGTTVEPCKSMMLQQEGAQYMKCLSSYALSTLSNCAQTASCAAFNDEFEACAQEKLGMFFGEDS